MFPTQIAGQRRRRPDHHLHGATAAREEGGRLATSTTSPARSAPSRLRQSPRSWAGRHRHRPATARSRPTSTARCPRSRTPASHAVLFCNDPVNTIKFIQAAQRSRAGTRAFVGGFVAADDVPQVDGRGLRRPCTASRLRLLRRRYTAGMQQYRPDHRVLLPEDLPPLLQQAAYIGAEAVVAALRRPGRNLTRAAPHRRHADVHRLRHRHGPAPQLRQSRRPQGPSGSCCRPTRSLKWHVASGTLRIRPG